MTLFALGINHNTAALDVRESLAFGSEELSEALNQAVVGDIASEIAILSTCNRTEIYCDTEHNAREIARWLADKKGVDVDQIMPSCYVHEDWEAARHMMRVASGLDSMILGEPQILGQMKSCYSTAERSSAMGQRLLKVFQQVFAVAKRVRSETSIGENPVSVAYAAVSLAQQIFSDLRRDTALLVGAGETIELVARHLKEAGVKKILVANRTLENGMALAERFDGEAFLLSDLPQHLHEADIVITSTASPLPLIGKGMVERALKARKHKPVFMVDIAVPRDIELEVGELNDIFLYTVDDLTEVVDENKKSREQAAAIAEEIIEEGVKQFLQEQQAMQAVDAIRQFRNRVGELTADELSKALRNLRSGQDAEKVLERFAHTLSNKFMHEPTAQLKRAAIENDLDFVRQIERLYSPRNEKP